MAHIIIAKIENISYKILYSDHLFEEQVMHLMYLLI